MPTDDGLWLDNHKGLAPAGLKASQNHPEQPVGRAKRWPGPFPLQDSHLPAESEYLCVERRKNDLKCRAHVGNATRL